MRRVASTLFAGLLMAPSLAGAADMPLKSELSPFSWSGVYAGANAGWGSGNLSDQFGDSVNVNGFIGGAQIGYNWQTGNLIAGIEADYQGSSQQKTNNFTVAGIAFSDTVKIPSFGTVRGRIGYAFDHLMVYATGGWAYTTVQLSVSALGLTASSSSNKSAWTLGGGMEWMLWDRWSSKIEYLYIDTGTVSATLFGVTFNGRSKDNIIRLGLNYHF